MRKALIVVDMLRDFVHKDGALFFPTAADIVPAVLVRLEAHRARGAESLIIFICDSHDKDDKEFERFPAHAITNSWGSDVIDALTPLGNESIVYKKRYSGFFGTELDEKLRVWAPEEIEVVGVCTSICVMDTVGGLANRDYKVVVPYNAVADFDADAHTAAIGRMATLYGAEIIQS